MDSNSKILTVDVDVSERHSYTTLNLDSLFAGKDLQLKVPPLSSVTISTHHLQQLMSSVPKISLSIDEIYRPQEIEEYQKQAAEIQKIARQLGEDILNMSAPLFEDIFGFKKDELELEELKPQKSLEPFDPNNLADLIKKDKEKAKEVIYNLVKEAKALKKSILQEIQDKPISSYDQMIQEYLGKDFKPKHVDEILINPDLDFQHALFHFDTLSRKLYEKSMKQTKMMYEEAYDTSFPGITSEGLATAFAILSTDSNGKNFFAVDREGIKRHLMFVENVRNIPTDYIIANPHEATKKILSEFYRADYQF